MVSASLNVWIQAQPGKDKYQRKMKAYKDGPSSSSSSDNTKGKDNNRNSGFGQPRK
jgi:hypothetical protein